MELMTATEASRNFSDVLDRAEHGETIFVTRGGKQVAALIPAPEANGRAVRELFSRTSGRPRVDPGFAEDIRSVHEVLYDQGDQWPAD